MFKTKKKKVIIISSAIAAAIAAAALILYFTVFRQSGADKPKGRSTLNPLPP